MPTTNYFKSWKKILINSGFKIKEAKSTFPNRLLIDIWNIGLRPIFHLLIQMSENLSADDRRKIKAEWVDIFFKLWKPLLSIKEKYPTEKAPYIDFILEK